MEMRVPAAKLEEVKSVAQVDNYHQEGAPKLTWKAVLVWKGSEALTGLSWSDA